MLVGYFNVAVGCIFLMNVGHCNPIVQIKSSGGDFDIELFDDLAPLSVKNFLNYIESGQYNGTVIHRSVPSFVIQGGWLSYQSENNTLTSIEVGDAIPNEFRLSNTRGTVSMAKVPGDPNSATSQWFINLGDNSKILDAQNGGFTVFGRVVGKGMEVVDEIARLERYTVGGIENFPLINYNQGPISKGNLLTILSMVVQPTENVSNYFDLESSELRITLDGGDFGMATLALGVDVSESPPAFKLVLNSIQWLNSPVVDMAIFNISDSSIFISELFVGGVKAYKNLKLNLVDSQQFSFVLDSYDKL